MLKQLLNRISGLTQLSYMTICTLNYAPRHFIKSLKARRLERCMKVLKILSSVLKYFLMRKSSQQTPFWNSQLVTSIISNFGNKSPKVLQYLAGNAWYKLGEKVGAEIPFFCHGYANYTESNYMWFQGDVSWHIGKKLAKLTLLICDKWISDSPSIQTCYSLWGILNKTSRPPILTSVPLKLPSRRSRPRHPTIFWLTVVQLFKVVENNASFT